MDCPSEENLIRMKFEELTQIKHLEFDLNHRELTVFHKLGIEEIEECLKQLNLGHKKLYTKKKLDLSTFMTSININQQNRS